MVDTSPPPKNINLNENRYAMISGGDNGYKEIESIILFA
jgi:hypothetical protein